MRTGRVSPKLPIFLFEISGVHSGPHERRLLNDLLEKYNDLERPVFNESEALTLKFGLTLQQIIDVVRILYSLLYILSSSEPKTT